VDKRHAEPVTPETDAQRAFVAAWAAMATPGAAPPARPERPAAP
jgi:hypothetical protein